MDRKKYPRWIIKYPIHLQKKVAVEWRPRLTGRLLRLGPGTLAGLFSQILQGDDVVRERAIKFLSTKLKTLPEDVMTKEVDDYVFAETKKVRVFIAAAPPADGFAEPPQRTPGLV